MSADKNPLDDAIEQALDAFVYAPIGLFLDGPARFPKLVKNGRNQVTNARMMGQFAVQTGKAEVTKRAQATDGPLREVLVGLGVVEAPEPAPAPTPTAQTPTPAAGSTPTKKKTSAKKTGTKKTGAKKTGTKKTGTKKTGAKKTGAKKTGAKKTAARATPGAPSATSLPIPDYDSLSASQVVSRLRGLSSAELQAVESYEAARRARKTVLGKVTQLLDR